MHRVAKAVRRILTAAHSKKDMIDLRRKKLEMAFPSKNPENPENEE